jgi:hypothetical protein
MEEREDEWQEQGGGEQSTEGGPTGVEPEDAEAGAGEGDDDSPGDAA